MKFVEHEHQKALIDWARVTRLDAAPGIEAGSYLSDYLFAIPNGGKRSLREAARLKAEGVLSSVSDLFLPIVRNGYAGFWIEMKAPGRKPTKGQGEWLLRMRKAGYKAEWADNWVKASHMIEDYLG